MSRSIFGKHSLFLAMGVLLVLSACGKNDTLDKEEAQRSELASGLKGKYTTLCENQKKYTLTLTEGRFSLQLDTFGDKVGCTIPNQTIRQDGKLVLVNHYKEGESNRLVFESDPALFVTLHTDPQISNVTSLLSTIRAAKPSQISSTLSPADQSDARRANQKLLEGQKVTDFSRDQEKQLSDLQLEELNDNGFGVLSLLTFNSRVTYTYNIDDNYLELGEFPIFTK